MKSLESAIFFTLRFVEFSSLMKIPENFRRSWTDDDPNTNINDSNLKKTVSCRRNPHSKTLLSFKIQLSLWHTTPLPHQWYREWIQDWRLILSGLSNVRISSPEKYPWKFYFLLYQWKKKRFSITIATFELRTDTDANGGKSSLTKSPRYTHRPALKWYDS